LALIAKRADEHAAQASRYRLNQKSGLSKASDIKAKENILKQQRKAETVTIEAQLFMFGVNSVQAKKVSPLFFFCSIYNLFYGRTSYR
jgi:hypothetical protein